MSIAANQPESALTVVNVATRMSEYACVRPDQAAIVEPDGWDAAIAVSTECGDLTGSCVAASDSGGSGDEESVTVSLTDTGGAQTVTLIVDSSLGPDDPLGCGDFTLRITPAGGTPVRPTTWGAIKAIYRSDPR